MLDPFPKKFNSESIWNNCMMNSSNEDSVMEILILLKCGNVGH